jgi:hypothetical protein
MTWAVFGWPQLVVEFSCLLILTVDLAMVFYYADRSQLCLSTTGWNLMCVFYVIMRTADLSTRSWTQVTKANPEEEPNDPSYK